MPAPATQAASGAGQSVPPWEALPPEADAAFLADEPPAIGPDEMDLPPPADAHPRPSPQRQAASPSDRADTGPDTRAHHPGDTRPRTAAAWPPGQGAAPAATPADKPARTVSIQLPPPGSDPLSDEWADLVGQLHARGAITALVRELAIQSQLIGREQADGRTLLRLKVERESLCGAANRERLTQALTQHLGREVQIEIDRGPATNTPAQRDQVARERRQHRAEDLIENDPLVRSLLAQHPGARLVPGSIRPL